MSCSHLAASTIFLYYYFIYFFFWFTKKFWSQFFFKKWFNSYAKDVPYRIKGSKVTKLYRKKMGSLLCVNHLQWKSAGFLFYSSFLMILIMGEQKYILTLLYFNHHAVFIRTCMALRLTPDTSSTTLQEIKTRRFKATPYRHQYNHTK